MKKMCWMLVLVVGGCLAGEEGERGLEEHAWANDESVDSLAAEAGEHGLTAFREPFREAIAARVDRSAAEISRLTSTARVSHALECLHVHGHSAPAADIEALLVDDPELRPTLLDTAVATVVAGQSDVERIGIPEPVLATCLDDAETRIDPPGALADLLEEATVDISDRLRSDPTMQEAFAEERACIAQTGFGYDDMIELAEQESMASEVAASFLNGEVSQDDALVELRQLEAERASYQGRMQAVERCAQTRLVVERALVVEQQTAYLQTHPGWIEGVAESYRAAVPGSAD